jgi:hypothetical protein
VNTHGYQRQKPGYAEISTPAARHEEIIARSLVTSLAAVITWRYIHARRLINGRSENQRSGKLPDHNYETDPNGRGNITPRGVADHMVISATEAYHTVRRS